MLPLFFLLSACVPHNTNSTEVGVRTVRVALIGQPGVVDEPYPPGGTYFLPIFLNDWNAFDIGVQNLAMTADKTKGARAGDDSVSFKTADGNDISVDVTVTWRIIAEKTPYLLQFVGEDTKSVEERLVRPVTRATIRDILNQLRSEQFYDATVRFTRAEDIRTVANEFLNPEGVMVEQVLLGEHKFTEKYEDVIKAKTLAEQEAAKLRSESEAAREQMRRELEVAKGEVNQKIEQARGEAQQVELGADADYFSKQRQAEGRLAEARANAEGLKAKAKAMAGAGGRSMVKLKVAEALQDKPILFMPTGGMDLRKTDMNSFLQDIGALSTAGEKSP